MSDTVAPSRSRRRASCPAQPQRVRHVAMIVAAMTLCATVAACGHAPAFELQSISGAMPNLQFHLTDDDGRAVSAQDYRRDVVLLYFGYTHCPDVCPTTLAMLSQAINGLGADATRTRVLFVTVDPGRDSAALLRRYVGYFGPQFVGLRGDDAQLRPLIMRYDASFHRDAPDRDGNYAVQHSSSVYIFDAKGHARLLTDGTDKPTEITHDLHELIAGA